MDPQPSTELLRALQHSKRGVRLRAARTLAQSPQPVAGSLPGLLAALSDTAVTVRRAVAAALVRHLRPADLPHIERALAGADAAQSGRLLWVLEQLGDQALPLYVQALAHPLPWVRCAAAASLARLGHQPAGRDIAALLDSDFDYERLAAIAAVGALSYRPALPRLLSLLTSSNFEVREATARVLGTLRDPGAVEALLARVRADANSCTRAAAVRALIEIAPPHDDGPRDVSGMLSGMEAGMLAALDDSYCLVSWEAALWLGARGHPAARPRLREILDEQWSGYLKRAGEVLSGQPQLIELSALLRALDIDNRHVQRSLHSAVRAHGQQAVPALLETLAADGASANLRAALVEILES